MPQAVMVGEKNVCFWTLVCNWTPVAVSYLLPARTHRVCVRSTHHINAATARPPSAARVVTEKLLPSAGRRFTALSKGYHGEGTHLTRQACP